MLPNNLSCSEQKVFKLLSGCKKPLSAYEILDRLRPDGVRSPPTVYRALNKLLQNGLVHRVESLNAFIACRHGCKGGDRTLSCFAICTSCGKVQELTEPARMKDIQRLSGGFLAYVDTKVVEISGLCHHCLKTRKGPDHV